MLENGTSVQPQFFTSPNGAAATQQGKRPSQKDSFYLAENGDAPPDIHAICIVADGHGEQGAKAGKEALEIFVRVLKETVRQEGVSDIQGIIRRSIDIAHQELVDGFVNGGTTFVGAIYVKDRVVFINIGDSRAYVVPKGRDEHIKRLTRDHSVAKGSNVVTRALGNMDRLPHDADIVEYSAGLNDTVILCSDGVSNVLSDEKIEEIVRGKSPQDIVHAIMQAAQNGEDNKTVIALQIF